MSAKLAEAIAKVAQLHIDLAEAYTELSTYYDVEGAKSGKSGGDGANGKAAGGSSGKTVASKTGAVGKKAVDDDIGDNSPDDDDLPEPTAPAGKKTAGKAAAAKPAGKAAKAKKAVTEEDVRAKAKEVIEVHGKDAVVEVLQEFGNGKLSDVSEDDYAPCLAKLQEKLDEVGGDDNDDI